MVGILNVQCKNWGSINWNFVFLKQVECDSINIPGCPVSMLWSYSLVGLATLSSNGFVS
jgi:hypothetical protein